MKWACRKATAPSLCISQFASPATGCTPALRQGAPSRRIRNWREGGEGAVGELTVCRLSGTNLCKVHSLGARQLHMKSCKPLPRQFPLFVKVCHRPVSMCPPSKSVRSVVWVPVGSWSYSSRETRVRETVRKPSPTSTYILAVFGTSACDRRVRGNRESMCMEQSAPDVTTHRIPPLVVQGCLPLPSVNGRWFTWQ
jgi:hypothetical protein